MALLRHVHLSYSVASDEKLLETSHCLGTGGPAASRHRGGAIGQGRKYGPLYVPYADFFQYQAGPGRLADRA